MRRYATRHIYNPFRFGVDIEAFCIEEAEAISLAVQGPEYEVMEIVGEVRCPEAIEVKLMTDHLVCPN